MLKDSSFVSSSFVSGYRFSDTVSPAKSNAPLGARRPTHFNQPHQLANDAAKLGFVSEYRLIGSVSEYRFSDTVILRSQAPLQAPDNNEDGRNRPYPTRSSSAVLNSRKRNG
jgi:hypothetical protein